jgi:hypothetical protein
VVGRHLVVEVVAVEQLNSKLELRKDKTRLYSLVSCWSIADGGERWTCVVLILVLDESHVSADSGSRAATAREQLHLVALHIRR